jgi:site-specific recombinase XerD
VKWGYWMALYLETHCTARGLRALSIAAYQATLKGFREYVRERLEDREPDRIRARDVLEYVEYLRRERDNGPSAVNRQVTVLRSFYRAIVAMGHLEPRDDPMAHFPKIKAGARKLPSTLNREEVRRLIEHPDCQTVMGLRRPGDADAALWHGNPGQRMCRIAGEGRRLGGTHDPRRRQRRP